MKINIETIVDADIDSVWTAWNTPADIVQWNAASDDWHTTNSAVDLVVGGKFSSRMEAKDGSMGFDFEGTYINIIHNQLIEFILEDERVVSIQFQEVANGTAVIETFDAEGENSAEQQRQGWQSILNNFKKYVESNSSQL